MQRNITCPSCSRGLFAGDAFCSWCGTPLGDPEEVSGSQRESYAAETIAPVERQSCTSCNSPILPGDTFCAACGARYGDIDIEPSSGYDSAVPSQLVEANRGKYEIIRELGRGGMGYVYLARDLELNRLDAIKVLKPSMLTEEGMVERFRREARTIANLRHPSIVSVYGVGQAENLYYFVMDYIDGTSLSRILKNFGRLSIPVVEAILYQVGSALSYAHKSVIHRDVKPANIMLNRDGRAVVTDFGIAKVTEVQGGLTRTGVLMGTPEYMSPEQCRESSVTHHTDQYALGAVAFAMLTGAPPFTGQWMQVAAAHQNKPVPEIRDLRSDCPEPLAETIERMLAKYPSERWPDISDALSNLELRPMAHDDPARVEISELVDETMEIDEARRAAKSSESAAPSRTPTDLRIMPPPDEIELGDVVPLHANMVFSDGVEEDGEGLSWESTDPSIARVSNTGELEAVGVGSVEITARRGDVSGSLAVGVVAPRVAELVISPESVELKAGETLQMRAEARNKHGQRMERPVSWSTSNPRLLRISESGLVTARRPGTASVLATCEGAGSAATVVVPGDGSEAVGDTTPPSGRSASAEAGVSAGMGPSTTDPTARTVPLRRDAPADTPNAVPPAEGRQEAPRHTPTARPASSEAGREPAGETRPNGKSGSRWWLVAMPLLVALAGVGWWFFGPSAPPPAADIRIINARTGESVGDEIELRYGETLPLNATATGADGQPLDRPVEWRIEDPSVASVSQAGVLSAVSGGATTLLTSVDSLTQEVPLRVSVPITSVSIVDGRGNPVEQLSLDVGQAVDLGAVAVGEDGSRMSGDVSWQSRTPAILSVDNDGNLLARGPGATFVDASVGGVTGSIAVSVLAEERPPQPEEPITVDIVITVAPWASLFVNGSPIGTEEAGTASGRYQVQLMPGPNRIRLEHPAFQVFQDTIDPSALPVEPGAQGPQLRVDMIPRRQEAMKR